MAKILIFSQDVIGKSMAGPGIRSWELAVALADGHEVTLAAPNEPDVESEAFAILSYGKLRIPALMRGYDVVITQVISPAMGYVARKRGIKLILDAYDPMLLEALEIYHREPAGLQRDKNKRYWTEANLSLMLADAVICASEKQRDLWIGVLMGLDRVRPDDYAKDVTMRTLVDVVPFGLRERDPEKKAGVGFRKKFGIKASDTVLVWAGGIYEWYDTPTLMRAMALVTERRSDVKLVFLGLRHPNAGVLESDLTARTKQLADDLGLTDTAVFFNFGWIGYEDWPSYLLETDIGLSTHFDHLETRFSFRTRVIDSYLWGLRPIITTRGDAMAELVQMHGLGRVVDYEDAKGLAEAIVGLADDKTEYAATQERMRGLREEYRWKRVVRPVFGLVDELAKQPVRRYNWAEIRLSIRMYGYILERIRDEKGWWRVVTNVAVKVYQLTLGRVFGVLN